MTAEQVFSVVNTIALVSWIVLGLAVWRKSERLRDGILGRGVTTVLSMVYVGLIVLFFGRAEGGFDTLANVKMLFTSDWTALAGWVHYLAFDLFVGCWISRQVMTRGMNRLWLVVLLPATFLFGPMGFLGYQIAALLAAPVGKEI
jgi:hypothetical protein